MEKLCQRIGYTKRKFLEINTLMDAVYNELQEATTKKKKELQELEKEFLKTHPQEDTDKLKIIKKIQARMIYLNRTNSIENQIKLTELAKLLSYIEEKL